MDIIYGTSRFSSKIVSVLLTQTDTTVGFLSQDEEQLKKIKSRNQEKPFIKVFSSFKNLAKHTIRIPQNKKNLLRRSKKTTFVVKDIAFRVTQAPLHSKLLDYEWMYSTSANESGQKFDRIFCEEKADIIIENKDLLYEEQASSLYKINAKRRRKLR